jgi:hypothetical protein
MTARRSYDLSVNIGASGFYFAHTGSPFRISSDSGMLGGVMNDLFGVGTPDRHNGDSGTLTKNLVCGLQASLADQTKPPAPAGHSSDESEQL